jgi:hypothetical protein
MWYEYQDTLINLDQVSRAVLNHHDCSIEFRFNNGEYRKFSFNEAADLAEEWQKIKDKTADGFELLFDDDFDQEDDNEDHY